MSLEGAGAVRVKEEPVFENETAAQADLHTEHEVKREHEREAGAQAHVEVKGEPECASEEGLCGVSAAAARAGLYTDHMVKGELVMGPEDLHRPQVFLHPGLTQDSKKQEREANRRKQGKIVSSTNNRPYKCALCSFASTYKHSLHVHEKTHTGEKPYKCTHCSYSSAHKHSLKRHEMKHTGTKPYKCAHCSYSCAQKCNLTDHEKTHTGKKPYKCAHCIYSSAKKSGLTRHEKAHTGEKPYKCAHCIYSCTKQNALTRHVMTHTVEKPFIYPSAKKRPLKCHEMKHTCAITNWIMYPRSGCIVIESKGNIPMIGV